jgi:hypothetical protein
MITGIVLTTINFITMNANWLLVTSGILTMLSITIPFSKRIPISILFYREEYYVDTRTNVDRGIEAFFSGFFGDVGGIINSMSNNSQINIKRTGFNNLILFLGIIFSIYFIYKRGVDSLLVFWKNVIFWLPNLLM